MSHPESARILPPLPDWLEGDLPAQGSWTYEDYRRTPDDGKRYEVIRGVLHVSPAPAPHHQRVLARLFKILDRFVTPREIGEVFLSPLDVLLPGLASPTQPDILFVRRERAHIVKKLYILGAPDLVVEILSPSNTRPEMKVRLDVLAEGCVDECWVVDPETRKIEVHVRDGAEYRLLGLHGADGAARSRIVEGLEVPVAEVFPDDTPDKE